MEFQKVLKHLTESISDTKFEASFKNIVIRCKHMAPPIKTMSMLANCNQSLSNKQLEKLADALGIKHKGDGKARDLK